MPYPRWRALAAVLVGRQDVPLRPRLGRRPPVPATWPFGAPRLVAVLAAARGAAQGRRPGPVVLAGSGCALPGAGPRCAPPRCAVEAPSSWFGVRFGGAAPGIVWLTLGGISWVRLEGGCRVGTEGRRPLSSVPEWDF
nr:hypothetical protein KitaXyl93_76250 [Kitasatospora sp. Xyl93]